MNRDDLYWPAFLIAMSMLLWSLLDNLETERVIEDAPVVEVTPRDYYPPRKDTSAIARLCCRVSR